MNEVDIVKENLNTILKNGDLFDVICLKEGVKPRNHAFLKLNILILSRILYGGVLVWEKIKSYFAPVEKVRNAQDQIRKILGINVDIISFKNNLCVRNRKLLSILYEEDSVSIDSYINNLQKILDFAELYNIKEILLREDDILNTFGDIDLDSFLIDSLRIVLGGYLENGLDEVLLSLTPSELHNLIKILKMSKTDKKFIWELGSKIDDSVIQKALDDFFINDDGEKLKSMVLNRLVLNINSDSTYKDRINGKVFESVRIKDEYVNVLTTNHKGEIINNRVVSLYDYLGVLNYQDLLLKIEKINDNQEVLLMASLYLYLYQTKKIVKYDREECLSFYDKIYGRFKAKKKKKLKNVRGIYSKSYKYFQNFFKMYSAFLASLILLMGICLAGWSYDFMQTFLFKKEESNILKNVIETIILPYKYSWQLEWQLGDKVLNITDSVSQVFCDMMGSFTGDSDNINDNIEIGSVKLVNESCELPRYYATGYARGATYLEGQMNYNIVVPKVNAKEIQNVEPILKVTYNVRREDINNYLNDYEINLLPLLYPLGDNYVLTKVIIWDGRDNTKVFTIDYVRAQESGNMITPKEKELLLLMQEPIIACTYGISLDAQNSFVANLEKESSYTSLTQTEVREIILDALELKEDASIEEILNAIKEKTYSKTPIRDAGLSNKIKNMDEKEYIHTIASLDSLICNLAATLAVETDEELVYVVGYMDNTDGKLLTEEKHAWAINSKGDIIDVTPSTLRVKNDSDNIIRNILVWGLQSGISIVVLISLIHLVIKKLFGHDIIFMIEVAKINKLLNDSNTSDAYAKIKEVLYGGINIPRETNSGEFIDTINKEFASFSKDELKELKRLLEEKKDENKELFDRACKLVQEMPFIRENAQELKRLLEKRKK